MKGKGSECIFGQAAQREAVKALNGAGSEADGAQNWAQFQTARPSVRAN